VKIADLKVGQRVRFRDSGAEREGLIRSFQFAEWHDDGLVLVDIDPPLRGPISGSIRRIEPERITEIVGALKQQEMGL
jgi:hypothetical protein